MSPSGSFGTGSKAASRSQEETQGIIRGLQERMKQHQQGFAESNGTRKVELIFRGSSVGVAAP